MRKKDSARLKEIRAMVAKLDIGVDRPAELGLGLDVAMPSRPPMPEFRPRGARAKFRPDL